MIFTTLAFLQPAIVVTCAAIGTDVDEQGGQLIVESAHGHDEPSQGTFDPLMDPPSARRSKHTPNRGLMTKQLEVLGKERPLTRLMDWFDPLEMPKFFDVFRPFEDRIPVEEEIVDGNLVIRAEMPGVDPDKDVKIFVEDDVLTLSAERRREETKETDGGFRSEFHYGSFTRSMHLPKGTTVKNVKASYHDGILEVKVPAPKSAGTAHKVTITKV